MKTRFKHTIDEPFNGWKNRPTWAMFTWLSNVETWYLGACNYSDRDVHAFAKHCIDVVRRDPVAVGDINPSGATHRFDAHLREAIDWESIQNAFRDNA
jgi:hypothetical protein